MCEFSENTAVSPYEIESYTKKNASERFLSPFFLLIKISFQSILPIEITKKSPMFPYFEAAPDAQAETTISKAIKKGLITISHKGQVLIWVGLLLRRSTFVSRSSCPIFHKKVQILLFPFHFQM